VFGFSFGEILVISLVTLVAVGPQKLPGMLKTMGQWMRKLRQMTMDVRQQTGIDEMLRAEGIQLSELRSLMRGYHGGISSPIPSPAPAPTPPVASTPVSSAVRNDDPYEGIEPDPTREYPLEGADAYGALPDDLMEPSPSEVATAPGPPPEPPVVAPASEPEPEPAAAVETVPNAAEPAPEPASAPAPSPAPVREPSAPEIEPEPEPVIVKPAPAPARSAPPPPPSRAGIPRPAGTPPPPPRRTVPPRPEPVSQPESTAKAAPSSPGTANGNG
jgi:sec-independent protein translocase protein TatB